MLSRSGSWSLQRTNVITCAFKVTMPRRHNAACISGGGGSGGGGGGNPSGSASGTSKKTRQRHGSGTGSGSTRRSLFDLALPPPSRRLDDLGGQLLHLDGAHALHGACRWEHSTMCSGFPALPQPFRARWCACPSRRQDPRSREYALSSATPPFLKPRSSSRPPCDLQYRGLADSDN